MGTILENVQYEGKTRDLKLAAITAPLIVLERRSAVRSVSES